MNQQSHLASDPAAALHVSADWAAGVIGAMTFSGSLVAFGKLQVRVGMRQERRLLCR